MRGDKDIHPILSAVEWLLYFGCGSEDVDTIANVAFDLMELYRQLETQKSNNDGNETED